jgi:hypothetical protein
MARDSGRGPNHELDVYEFWQALRQGYFLASQFFGGLLKVFHNYD